MKKKNIKNSPLFQLFALFLDENEKEDLKLRFETPGTMYGDVKIDLYTKIMTILAHTEQKEINS